MRSVAVQVRAWIAYSLLFAAFCGFNFQLHALAAGIAFQDFSAKLEFHALLFQNLFCGF